MKFTITKTKFRFNREQIRFMIIDNYFVERNFIARAILRMRGEPATKWDFLRQELRKEQRLSDEHDAEEKKSVGDKNGP